MNNGSLNGHAERTKLALEVQAEALRPTPPINVVERTARERLEEATRRISDLEGVIVKLRRLMRNNHEQYQREVARQRRELGIEDEISVNAAQQLTACVAPTRANGAPNLLTNQNKKENNDR